jgi:hypothetical protein
VSERRRRRLDEDSRGGLPLFPLVIVVILAGLLMGGARALLRRIEAGTAIVADRRRSVAVARDAGADSDDATAEDATAEDDARSIAFGESDGATEVLADAESRRRNRSYNHYAGVETAAAAFEYAIAGNSAARCSETAVASAEEW